MVKKIRTLHLDNAPEVTNWSSAQLPATGLEREMENAGHLSKYFKVLEKSNYSIILSIFSIPGTDSLTELKTAKQTNPETSFILVSGLLAEEKVNTLLKLGAPDYILKANTN